MVLCILADTQCSVKHTYFYVSITHTVMCVCPEGSSRHLDSVLFWCFDVLDDTASPGILLCKAKMKYLLTLQVSRYCILPYAEQYSDPSLNRHTAKQNNSKQLLLFAFSK